MFFLRLGEARGGAGGRKALPRALSIGFALIPFHETPVGLMESFPLNGRNVTNFLLENTEGMAWKTDSRQN